jgi:hypothetical protein
MPSTRPRRVAIAVRSWASEESVFVWTWAQKYFIRVRVANNSVLLLDRQKHTKVECRMPATACTFAVRTIWSPLRLRLAFRAPVAGTCEAAIAARMK